VGIPVTGPAKVRQVGVAPLPDGRLQLWAVDEAGKLFSTWQSTLDPNASWVAWEDFLAEEKFQPPKPAKVRQVEVAPLPDGRLQLWAVDDAGQLFRTQKVDNNPNAHWEPWKDFRVKVPPSFKVRQEEVAPLPDGRLQLWAVSETGQLSSTWQSTSDPASWVAWKDFRAHPVGP
jgi:hypothetical protein